MSVTGQLISISYATNGVAVAFPYPYYLFEPSDLDVWYQTAAGIVRQLALTTDYTISGVADTFGAYPHGVTVTTNIPLATGTLLLTRTTLPTQEILYINNDKFDSDKHEHALDKLTLMVQEIKAVFAGSGLAPPPNGTGTFGQIIWNLFPEVGGFVGWVYCIDNTWKPFGNIFLTL